MTFRPTARSALAALLVDMAAGQLSDIEGFARVLGTYRVIPDRLLSPFAWGIGAAEAAAGILLWRDRPSGGRIALAVAGAWTALSFSAFTRRLSLDNCGCFGTHAAQSLRWWVLVEDIAFVALALRVAAKQPRKKGRPLRERPAP